MSGPIPEVKRYALINDYENIIVYSKESNKCRQHKKLPKSLCELGKTWKYSLRLTLKNPNFESMDEL